jgi:prepilin-type N-terminal cleavage/methylation domain-containing protein
MKTPVIASSMRIAQSGFTLVELMIAVTIALFLVGGLVTLVDGMKRASLSRDGMSQLGRQRMAAIDDRRHSIGQLFPLRPSILRPAAAGDWTIHSPASLIGTGAGTPPHPATPLRCAT